MIAMTVAFGVAGVTQVYLERKVGLDFLQVQEEIEVHFLGVVLAACVFASGIGAYVVQFVRYGRPVGEVVPEHREELASSLEVAAEGTR
jgi:nitric oxide reductase subunit B